MLAYACLHYCYYFRATSMARMCLVRLLFPCYCADRTCDCSSPKGADLSIGGVMRIMHLCYAAIGFAVARWIFKRQPVPVADPVTRLRSSGLL